MTNQGLNGYPGRAVAVGAAFPVGYLRSGCYYWVGSPNTSSTSNTLGVGTLRLQPWIVPNKCVISKVGASVTSGGDSGSLFRLGIYTDDGTGYPGALVLDAGTIAGDSATVQEISINAQLTSGIYWVGGAVQNTSGQPTLTTASGPAALVNLPVTTTTPGASAQSFGVSQASVTGALPAVFSTTLSAAGAMPRVFVKAA